MPVSFVREQKEKPRSADEGLKRVKIGLLWQDASKLDDQIDCDASVILCKNGKLASFKQDVVYYNNLHHVSGAISHQGDNYSGTDDGGDGEEIYIDLSCLSKEYDRVILVVTMYNSAKRKLDFGLLNGAYIHVCDIINDTEFCRINLAENFAGKSAIIVGELQKDPDGKWGYRAVNEGTNDNGILEVSKRFE